MREVPESLARALSALIGHSAWSVLGGLNTGSDFDLCLGGRRRRPEPLRNPTVTDEEREFDGEFALYVTCSWRLQSKEAVITSSLDDPADGHKLPGLVRLLGARVCGVTIEPPGMTITLSFSNDLQLVVFPVSSPHVDDLDYLFLAGDSSFSVESGGKVIETDRV